MIKAIVKYNPSLFWNMNREWREKKYSNIAATLGYCGVIMNRYTSLMGPLSEPTIEGYAGGCNSQDEACVIKSCSKDLRDLKERLRW